MQYEKCIKWLGHSLSIKIGEMANLADGAVVLRYGDTVILATTVIDKGHNPNIEFIPLTVNYLEKHYAAGRIPGGFFKREGKPNEHETLKSRLIDRALRPLLPDGLSNEVQVVITVLSYDSKVGTLIPSLLAASCSMMISGVPFKGPLAGVRVSYDGEFFFTTHEAKTNCDFIIAGTKNRVVMLEGTGYDFTPKMVTQACKYAFNAYEPIIKMFEDIHSKCAKKNKHIHIRKIDKKCYDAVLKREKDLKNALFVGTKELRRERIHQLKHDLMATHQFEYHPLTKAFEKHEIELLRQEYAKKKTRIDGRKFDEVRPISGMVNLLPGVHGSCLFTRGETQALVTLTLGRSDDRQYFDELSGHYSQSFLFHYNFPPFCVGETDRMGPPSRRELGHGYLAWRALKPVLPDHKMYTMRIVSEILASNGSSSMASVCGGTLALMSAGIHIKAPVAGVTVGYLGGDTIIVDLLGDEDHFGEMDLKLAGTEKGFTALQMDIKTSGISIAVLQKALPKGLQGIKEVLAKMKKIASKTNAQMSQNIPRVDAIDIGRDHIKTLLAKGGKYIKDMQQQTSTKIDVSERGRVMITGTSWKSVYAAKKMVRSFIGEPEKNVEYYGVISDIDKQGIIVSFNRYLKGLIRFHDGKEEKEARKKMQKGDEIRVMFLSLDRRGEINLRWMQEKEVVREEDVETVTDLFQAPCDIVEKDSCKVDLGGE